MPVGVTWGTPWPKGSLMRAEPLSLIEVGGGAVPVQSWPTAYWPDGSVKWSAHAASFTGEPSPEYYLTKSAHTPCLNHTAQIAVTDKHDLIEIDTGTIRCQLNKQGNVVIRSIIQGNAQLCSSGSLCCVLEDEQCNESGQRTRTEHDYVSSVNQVVMEQNGPVRAVARIEGIHKLSAGTREWLPFTLRMYFYAGQSSIRVVHTFIFDGDPQADCIKGIGMKLTLPMQGPLYNRHIRFAGDTGLFSESPKHLMTWRTKGKYEEQFRRQTAGEAISFDPHEDKRFIELIEDSATWDHFKLVQSTADSYTISKRTQEGCSWLKAAVGSRSKGLVFAGAEHGGLAAGIKNFWEKYPSSLELSHLTSESADMTLWFWSPDAAPMDLRHYDTATHVESAYEGSDEMRSTPHGIANTSELMLWCFERTPSHDTLRKVMSECQTPSLLHCEPEFYHKSRAFGLWSLPDRSSPVKVRIEEKLDEIVAFYLKEVEARRWYGFWDYGDVMHSYDPIRHTWCYDVGGFAWQNTELVPNMWLWLMFLRSGRADIYRMAEAMTRHTSEVDMYHLGAYKGLGSRHNVVHWGCGCKEARIAMAGLHRYYYYLTGDERVGDIMDEAADADFSTVHTDPMRSYYPKDQYPTHARVGPDWSAFTANWMTRWERYEDTAYRDKIMAGIESLKTMPNRMKGLSIHGYDPDTGQLYDMGINSGGHLAVCMGGPQVWTELALILQDPEWEEMLAEIGVIYHLPQEEKQRILTGSVPSGYAWPMFATGITAYAAKHYGSEAMARLAWSILLQDEMGQRDLKLEEHPVAELEYVRGISEIPWMTTNIASQWSLNAIMCLELAGRFL
ncbi:hypothetical protein GC101_11190 [Paenibacillus sp. LMG 31459]|uniref:Tat pathway signal sequence domain protein n=1 Tax=Paenibacillus phytohabitans TaxID=2654978 RepID=A0ABX1YHK6_9BACL|nr:hypothetical protein [Paenibacillus phytohabitans]